MIGPDGREVRSRRVRQIGFAARKRLLPSVGEWIRQAEPRRAVKRSLGAITLSLSMSPYSKPALPPPTPGAAQSRGNWAGGVRGPSAIPPIGAVLLGILALVLVLPREAHAGLPGNPEVERFAPIWKRSPFVAVTPTAAGEGIAGRFAVTGFAKLGESDIVFVFDRKELKRFAIAKESPVEGVELVSVAEGGAPGDFTARIRSGGELAEIRFDAALAAGPDPSAEKRAPASLSRATENGGQTASAVPGVRVPATLQAGSHSPQPPRAARVIRRRTISAQ